MKNIVISASLLLSTSVIAQDKQQIETTNDSVKQLKEVVISANQIIGSKFEAANKTGSASYISKEDLQKFNFTDINWCKCV